MIKTKLKARTIAISQQKNFKGERETIIITEKGQTFAIIMPEYNIPEINTELVCEFKMQPAKKLKAAPGTLVFAGLLPPWRFEQRQNAPQDVVQKVFAEPGILPGKFPYMPKPKKKNWLQKLFSYLKRI